MPLDAALADADAFVFDAYGTLFDVHSAVARHAQAVGPEAARLSDLWRTKQLEYAWVLSLAGRYEPFWTLTQQALDHALARCPSVDPAVRPRLLEAYRTLAAFSLRPDEVAFVSSNRWDVAGAAAFGFRPVWVNRSRQPEEYPGLEPLLVIDDLARIA